jgi:energy-coupling factor transporter ATPase
MFSFDSFFIIMNIYNWEKKLQEIIKLENIHYYYINHTDPDSPVHALKDLSVSVNEGEFIVVLGRNGSGKSTFARLLNGILIPAEGDISIFGMNPKEDINIWSIRKKTGMVFQNPENQIVGTIVEEDIAFGPENLGIQSDRIKELVSWALKATDMEEYRLNAPHNLSGGQKQRIAIAGILAMSPDLIVLDESTSMLDPISRKEIMSLISKLNKEENKTIIHITHHMEEAKYAGRVLVFDNGRIVVDDSPLEVFQKTDMLKSYGLDAPQLIEFENKLKSKYPLLNLSEITKGNVSKINRQAELIRENKVKQAESKETIIKISNLTYTYKKGEPNEKTAIKNINLDINKGELIGIIGPTGSGKSTLIQHFNGILKPMEGDIEVLGFNTKDKKLSELRKRVGLVFQYPEHQLFEETVYKDILFGLSKLSLQKEEEERRIYEILEILELDKSILLKSPFDLSGGQKRRVAIAGTAVMQPELLVLDEPTAGLDPEGREDIHRLIETMHEKLGITVCIVSHDMEYLGGLVHRLIVLDKGLIIMDDTKEKVFSEKDRLREIGMDIPEITSYFQNLGNNIINLKLGIFTVDEGIKEIDRLIKEGVIDD